MRRIIIAVSGALIALAAVTSAAASSPPAAIAAGQYDQASTNWSGYYIKPGKAIQGVHVEFTVPKNLSCKSGFGHWPRIAGMWAGIGGMPDIDGNRVRLEQAGIAIGCQSARSAPDIYPFWEVYPDNNVQTWVNAYGRDITARPGDLVDVMIWSPSSSARPGAFQFVVRTPEGSHTAFYKLPRGERPGTTAEAVTEWPWGRTQRGALMGLLDVGAIRFTHAVYLAHLPGGGYPGSFALTQHGLYMVHNGHEVIFPGKPWSPAPSGNADHNKKYDFNTYFTGLW